METCLPLLSASLLRLPTLTENRVLAGPGWGVLALGAASRWPWGASGIQVSCFRCGEGWDTWEPVKVGQNPRQSHSATFHP